MENNDKILKSSWNYVEGIKDVVQNNLMSAISDSKLKIESTVLPSLISLINYSIDEGYHKGQNVFLKELNFIFDNGDHSPKMKFKKN